MNKQQKMQAQTNNLMVKYFYDILLSFTNIQISDISLC